MAFHPITTGFSSSLLGIASTTTFSTPLGENIFGLLPEIHRPSGIIPKRQQLSVRTTIIALLIVGFIFLTILSLYNILLSLILNYFAGSTLKLSALGYNIVDIVRTLIVNRNLFIATIVIALIMIFLTCLFVPYLIQLIYQRPSF